MKYLFIAFSNGGQFRIPLSVIIKSRNDHYREVDGDDFDEQGETDYLMNDDYEAIDWAQNNMYWSELGMYAEKIDYKRNFDYEDEWPNAEEVKIISVKDKTDKSKPTKQWDKQWIVRSHSNPNKEYTVSLDTEGNYACSCKGWTTHTPRKNCKHIEDVLNGNGEEIIK